MEIIFTALLLLVLSVLLGAGAYFMSAKGYSGYRYVLVLAAMTFSMSVTLMAWFALMFR